MTVNPYQPPLELNSSRVNRNTNAWFHLLRAFPYGIAYVLLPPAILAASATSFWETEGVLIMVLFFGRLYVLPAAVGALIAFCCGFLALRSLPITYSRILGTSVFLMVVLLELLSMTLLFLQPQWAHLHFRIETVFGSFYGFTLLHVTVVYIASFTTVLGLRMTRKVRVEMCSAD